MDEAAKTIDSAPPSQAMPPCSAIDLLNDQAIFSTLQEISMTTMTTSLRFQGALATAIFGALVCSVTTVCTAAETDPPQTTVKYADLNVSNPQGAAALYARIQGAARQVCLPLDGGDLGSKARMGACVHKAIADAVAKVGQPALFDAYNAHNRQSTPIVLAASR
jgi:UrcA family protein